jgi:hypothetical protein
MQTRKLKDPSLVPPKGWNALQENGTVVRGLSFRNLMVSVEAYRKANGLEVPANLRRMVEDQVCGAMEAQGNGAQCDNCEWLHEDDMKNPAHLRQWTTGPADLLNFAKAAAVVVGEMAKGNPVCVPQAEAERRAAICSQCPYNIRIGNCWGCGELGKIFRSIQGGLSTSQDSKLESCERCGCALRTKVWINDDALSKVEREQGVRASRFPSWCWRK